MHSSNLHWHSTTKMSFLGILSTGILSPLFWQYCMHKILTLQDKTVESNFWKVRKKICILKSLEIRKIYPSTKFQMTMILINTSLFFPCPSFWASCRICKYKVWEKLCLLSHHCLYSFDLHPFLYLPQSLATSYQVAYQSLEKTSVQAIGIVILIDVLRKKEFLSVCAQVSRRHRLLWLSF